MRPVPTSSTLPFGSVATSVMMAAGKSVVYSSLPSCFSSFSASRQKCSSWPPNVRMSSYSSSVRASFFSSFSAMVMSCFESSAMRERFSASASDSTPYSARPSAVACDSCARRPKSTGSGSTQPRSSFSSMGPPPISA